MPELNVPSSLPIGHSLRVGSASFKAASVCIGLLFAMVPLASCDSGSESAERPPGAPGTTRVPTSPLLPGAIPGWHIEEAELVPGSSTAPQQSLYLGDGSTAGHGPAIVVGRLNDGQGSLLCGRGTYVRAKLNPSYPGQTSMRRHGNVVAVAGDVIDDVGYVVARGVPQDEVLRAARAVDFESPVSTIREDALPDGFRHAGTAPIPPNALALSGSESLVLGNDDPSTPYDIARYPDSSVRILAFDGDSQARSLARFWRATANAVGCEGTQRVARQIGPTTVVAEGVGTSRAVVQRVVDSLKPVSTARFSESARTSR